MIGLFHGLHFGFGLQPGPDRSGHAPPCTFSFSGIVHYKDSSPPAIQIIPGADYKQARKDTSDRQNGAGASVLRSIPDPVGNQTLQIAGGLEQPGLRRSHIAVVTLTASPGGAVS